MEPLFFFFFLTAVVSCWVGLRGWWRPDSLQMSSLFRLLQFSIMFCLHYVAAGLLTLEQVAGSRLFLFYCSPFIGFLSIAGSSFKLIITLFFFFFLNLSPQYLCELCTSSCEVRWGKPARCSKVQARTVYLEIRGRLSRVEILNPRSKLILSLAKRIEWKNDNFFCSVM